MAQLLGFIQALGGFIFIFGIVVLVHELGHFIAAKMVGVYAPRFSIGFGPGPSKRWGETQYQIGLIPLGGYVRMASREDEATAFLEGGSEAANAEKNNPASGTKAPKDWDPEAMIPFGPKPVPADRWFESKSLPKRLFILIAGVTMNALLTIFVIFCVVLSNGRPVLPTRVVAGIENIPAAQALQGQLLPGDTILQVDGKPVANWDAIVTRLLDSRGETSSLVTQRGPVSIAIARRGSALRDTLISAINPLTSSVIQSVVAGEAAALGGLRSRDSIVAIDNQPIQSFSDMTGRVRQSADRDLKFSVVREGALVDVVVRPKLGPVADEITGATIQAGRIGVIATVREGVGVPEAFGNAVLKTGELAGQIFGTLKGLVSREVSLKELGGPIEIARQSGRAAGEGMESLLGLLALLSIDLAVLNLLPIPVLDGGQILLVVAESVKGSPFSPRARQYILGTGVALVLLLMLVVSYNNVLRLFKR